MNRAASRTILVACLAATSACATGARWAKPIGDFKQSVDASVSVIGTYYEDLNGYERRLYLENAFQNPTEEIGMVGKDGKPTPLAGSVFTHESIKARLDALRLVSAYARRLADLAGSDAPTQFKSNADMLGESLTSLSKTFQDLSGPGAADPTASKYVGPVSSLVGLIGQIVLEQKRDAALKLAIGQGDAPVTAILNQVESDLATVIGPLRTSGDKLALAELVVAYNRDRTTLTPADRRRRLDQIADAADGYFMTIGANPAALVGGMRDAHVAMAKYAASPRQPADLAEFASALEVFANRVEAAAKSVRAIRDAE